MGEGISIDRLIVSHDNRRLIIPGRSYFYMDTRIIPCREGMFGSDYRGWFTEGLWKPFLGHLTHTHGLYYGWAEMQKFPWHHIQAMCFGFAGQEHTYLDCLGLLLDGSSTDGWQGMILFDRNTKIYGEYQKAELSKGQQILWFSGFLRDFLDKRKKLLSGDSFEYSMPESPVAFVAPKP
jgi:hypothetical protein